MYRISQIGVNIPAHVGVEGNEVVDKITKKALRPDEIDIKITLSKTEVKAALNSTWQEKINTETKGRHLFNIPPKVRI